MIGLTPFGCDDQMRYSDSAFSGNPNYCENDLLFQEDMFTAEKINRL
jgi:hypothetical protein